MASFSYEAINRNGRAVKGSVEADTLEHARTEVKKLGLTPVDVKPQGALNKDINIEIGGKPSPRDLSIFCRQFVSMLSRRSEGLKPFRDQICANCELAPRPRYAWECK